MQEYLEDVSKGQTICIKEISPYCKCYRCLHEKKEDAGENSKPVAHIEKQEN